MTHIVIREGEFLGFHEEHGYLYRLNGSFFAYKGGMVKLISKIK